MITTILPNSNPTDYEGASHKEDFNVISRDQIQPAISFNLCDFQCPFEEPKFAEIGAVTELYKNDKTDLLFTLSLVTDTITIKLFKCEDGAEVEQATITDDTLGTYFAPAFFPDSLKVGFFADWNLIITAFGPGKYFFKADRVIIGQASTVETWKYNLQEFSEEAANDTIKITSVKTGCIEGGIDYSGFIWTSEVRFNGTFGRPEPKLEKDHYQTQGRYDIQLRDKINTTYVIETELLPYEAIKPFIYDSLLANNIFITTYELQGFLPPYVLFNVVPEEIDGPTYFERNTNGKFSFVFKDKFNRPVKTNFV